MLDSLRAVELLANESRVEREREGLRKLPPVAPCIEGANEGANERETKKAATKKHTLLDTKRKREEDEENE